MWCGQHNDIMVFNALWKTYGHRVYRQQTFDIVCTVEHLLISWVLMHCGNLTVTVCTVNKHLTLCVLLKTYGHRVYRQHTFDIVCTVENERSSCVL